MNIADGIRALGFLVLLVAIGLTVLAVARAGRNQGAKGISTTAVFAFVAAGILIIAGMGLVFLQADQYAVVRSAFQPNGYRPEALGPGLHWVIPVAESVPSEYTYSVARQTYTMSSAASEGQQQGDDSIQARTKDGQQVYIDASVIYAVDRAQAVGLYKTWGPNYENGLVRPTSRGVIRDVASQYGVEEIVSSKRAEMESAITQQLEAT